MDNDGIAVRAGDDCHVTDGCLQRFKPERAKVLLEACNGRGEIFHFETDRPAAWGRLPIRCAVSDAERVRPEIVFDESLVSLAKKPRFFEAQQALLKPPRPGEVGNRITGERDVRDLHVALFVDWSAPSLCCTSAIVLARAVVVVTAEVESEGLSS